MSLPKGQHNAGIKNLISHQFPKGKNCWHRKEKIKKCHYCHNEFKTTATWAYYCSSNCKEKMRPEKQKKNFVCLFCGKPFKRRATNNIGKFCSRQCSGMYSTATGEKTYVIKAFIHYPHKCNICGIDDYNMLVVHHKDKNHNNNNIDNLEILCANHHHVIHWGNGRIKKNKLDLIIKFIKAKGMN